MKFSIKLLFFLAFTSLFLTSCVSKKKFLGLQTEYDKANDDLGKCGKDLNDYMNQLATCQAEKASLKKDTEVKDVQITDLKEQIADFKTTRDKQLEQVGDLTVLSTAANENINKTLSQLAERDKYIRLLQAAKTQSGFYQPSACCKPQRRASRRY
jgi:chemotaxis protein MotB